MDKKSLELERVQDLINQVRKHCASTAALLLEESLTPVVQAKRRKLCMLIADAEAKTKAAA